MKKRLLQIGSLLMTLVVLFVSMGWDVKFHYCTEDHHVTSSLGDAAAHCVHCAGHNHGHEVMEADLSHGVVHFEARCCCEDYESVIQFSDNYVFSPEKHFDIHFQPFIFAHIRLLDLIPTAEQAFRHFTAREVPHFLSARDRLVFFSALRLNPLVF